MRSSDPRSRIDRCSARSAELRNELLHTNGHYDETPIRVLGIGGSMRQVSKSRVLLTHALRLAQESGATTTLADVRALDLPLYDDDRAPADYPASLVGLLAAARAADAYVLCSPTYHGTVSGAVKNALDSLNILYNDGPRYFGGKPVALLALGRGGANVLTGLQHATHALNGIVIPTAVVAEASSVGAGTVDDERLLARMRVMVDELLDLAERLRRPAPVLGERFHHEHTLKGMARCPSFS